MKVTIHLPQGSRVLLLEDNLERVDWFRSKVPELYWVADITTAFAAMKQFTFDFFFLDRDLGIEHYSGAVEGSGEDFAAHLRELGYTGQSVVIHSWNPAGALRMKSMLPQATVLPFGEFDIRFYVELTDGEKTKKVSQGESG